MSSQIRPGGPDGRRTRCWRAWRNSGARKAARHRSACNPIPRLRVLESTRGGPMIARLWHGAVRAEQGEAYMRYLEKTGIPESRATPGNRGVYVLRRQEGDAAHFLFVSLWESREAIRAFAGEDI